MNKNKQLKTMEDNNKLIAEFMGSKHPKYEDMYRLPHADVYVGELQYDFSWDWLMPVIEEIDHLQHEPVQSIEDALATRCIEDTYNAVVEFIKQHNDGQG